MLLLDNDSPIDFLFFKLLFNKILFFSFNLSIFLKSIGLFFDTLFFLKIVLEGKFFFLKKIFVVEDEFFFNLNNSTGVGKFFAEDLRIVFLFILFVKVFSSSFTLFC